MFIIFWQEDVINYIDYWLYLLLMCILLINIEYRLLKIEFINSVEENLLIILIIAYE